MHKTLHTIYKYSVAEYEIIFSNATQNSVHTSQGDKKIYILNILYVRQ